MKTNILSQLGEWDRGGGAIAIKKLFQFHLMRIFNRSIRTVAAQIQVHSLFIMLLLSGCVATKDATYLQEYDESPYSGEYVPPIDYKIKTNDNLYIQVKSLDPTLALMFNAMDGAGAMRGDEASNQLLSYAVDVEGNVDLPYVGKVSVVGKTITEAKDAIGNVLEDYLRDASLTVKLVNNYVSILGEVRNPGMYVIYKDRLNIYEALAMGGDVAEFSERHTVSIIRETDGESIIKEFDVTDKKIIDSEFYYVLPGDVLYVKPMKGRFFAINTAPWTFALSTLTAAISLIILIQNNYLLRTQ